MFNGATFRENLFPLSENVNNYAAHIWRKYLNLDGNNKICGPGWEEFVHCK